MTVQRWWRGLPVLGASVLVVSCSPPPPPPGADVLSAEALGDPVPGLTAEELARFEAGEAAFSRVFLQEDGLGPGNKENACGACHSHPRVGGSGGGEFDLHATFEAEDGGCQRGLFTAPPLWGRGLVEAVADGTLLTMEDPDDIDGDGISGKVGRTADGRIGRFRRKADVADLADIADPVADPEIDRASIDAIADFIRFLAPPARNLPPTDAGEARVTVGEGLFHQVGCAACHIPTLETGPNPVAALSGKKAPLYSDLLLHDMGSAWANLCSPVASPSEFRTEILLGVALRAGYMHDGSAPTVWEAIAMHGGEGMISRDAFDALPELQRHAVVAFVLSL